METAGIQSRREFCFKLAGSAIAVTPLLAILIQACNKDNPTAPDTAAGFTTIQGSLSGSAVTVSVGSGSPLASVGGAAMVKYSGGTLLAARTAQNTILVVTSICTHQGCTIDGYANSLYVCPCHGSEFHTDGSVAKGPASSPLRTYQTQLTNDVLTISV